MTELEAETAKAIDAMTDLIIECKNKDEDDIRMIVTIFVQFMINKARKAGLV
jgi:hypothetical protein